MLSRSASFCYNHCIGLIRTALAWSIRMTAHHDTIIVGAGQAGLAMSYHLRTRGRDQVLLERHRIAERWRTERWDSLAFQMPNCTLSLPGLDYSGDDPDGFAHHEDILRFIETYAVEIRAPVRSGVTVKALRRGTGSGRYDLETSTGPVSANNVVIATGPFQRPKIPKIAAVAPESVFQTDPTQYKSPKSLPDGAVLVVGSGASGCQIADELLRSGSRVYLSLGRHRYAPRRYRGRDVIWWLDALGRFDVPVDSFPDRRYPPPIVITGFAGGYDLYPRRLGSEGAVLLGRVIGIDDGRIYLADDANPLLEHADNSCADFISAADNLGDSIGVPATDGDAPPPHPHPPVKPIQSLDLHDEGISSIVWATGYDFDFDWVKLPVLDPSGAPVQTRGITQCPGVYFLGLNWMHTFRSGLLSYVGQDAAFLADHIVSVSDARGASHD
jgi:putative flavoprotein involved in K+ transport